MSAKLRIGIVGMGRRGTSVTKGLVLPREDVVVAAECDLYEEKAAAAADTAESLTGSRPRVTTDFTDVTRAADVDAVLVPGSWDCHLPVAIDALKHGKPVGFEVGGAYAMQEVWKLVETAGETGVPCMMMENCCYGRTELMILNMVRQGLFGSVVHCAGGYHHDLRDSLSHSLAEHRYRTAQYLHRNCDNYPTHELGPIMKILGVNRGNRIVSLSSFASCARGMEAFVAKCPDPDENLPGARWMQGDVITTVLRCAHGETIVLTLDTTLPRWYSRGLTVQGTKGMYCEDNRSIFLDGQEKEAEDAVEKGAVKFEWSNEEKYRADYEHPIWKRFLNDGVRGGHGGMDWLVMDAFVRAVREGHDMPVDVIDTATMLAVSTLSEDSIAAGGAPLAFPDFTRGAWITRGADREWDYSL